MFLLTSKDRDENALTPELATASGMILRTTSTHQIQLLSWLKNIFSQGVSLWN